MIHRFLKVAPGFYRGSAPNDNDVKMLKNKFGINKIVSLDKDAGLKINKICKDLGINHIIIPIDGTRKSLLKFLKNNLKELFIKNGPTFVHCKHGKDRTGLAVALFKCKYMGVNPEEAIDEAKALGFGIGVDPEIIRLYEKLIRSCKTDENDADIVSLQRSNISDTRSGLLDEAHKGSFAPYLYETKQYPYDMMYPDISHQSETRQDYKQERKPVSDEKTDAPLVGQYNNSAGFYGNGPAFPSGGFIFD